MNQDIREAALKYSSIVEHCSLRNIKSIDISATCHYETFALSATEMHSYATHVKKCLSSLLATMGNDTAWPDSLTSQLCILTRNIFAHLPRQWLELENAADMSGHTTDEPQDANSSVAIANVMLRAEIVCDFVDCIQLICSIAREKLPAVLNDVDSESQPRCDAQHIGLTFLIDRLQRLPFPRGRDGNAIVVCIGHSLECLADFISLRDSHVTTSLISNGFVPSVEKLFESFSSFVPRVVGQTCDATTEQALSLLLDAVRRSWFHMCHNSSVELLRSIASSSAMQTIVRDWIPELSVLKLQLTESSNGSGNLVRDGCLPLRELGIWCLVSSCQGLVKLEALGAPSISEQCHAGILWSELTRQALRYSSVAREVGLLGKHPAQSTIHRTAVQFLVLMCRLDSEMLQRELRNADVSAELIYLTQAGDGQHDLDAAWREWSTRARIGKEHTDLDLEATQNSRETDTDSAVDAHTGPSFNPFTVSAQRATARSSNALKVPNVSKPQSVDMRRVTDRVGPLLVGIKLRFDKQVLLTCQTPVSTSASLPLNDATEVLLDLRIPDSALVGARERLLSLSPSGSVSFAALFRVFAECVGLCADPSDPVPGLSDVWCPMNSGMWAPVLLTDLVLLVRACLPASKQLTESLPTDREALAVIARAKEDVFVSIDELQEVMATAVATGKPRGRVSADVLQCIKPLSVFLPGLVDGRLSFQELAVVLASCKGIMRERQHSTLLDVGLSKESGPHVVNAGQTAPRASLSNLDPDSPGKLSGTASSGRAHMQSQKDGRTKQRAAMDQQICEKSLRSKKASDARLGDGGRVGVSAVPGSSSVRHDTLWAAFKRLDLAGDGTITFLKLKTVLELQGKLVADGSIREWIRRNDRHAKGYVTFEDFEASYLSEGASAIAMGDPTGS
jgi:hypothetical protein